MPGESAESRRARFQQQIDRAKKALEDGKLTAVRGYLRQARPLADSRGAREMQQLQTKLEEAAAEMLTQAEQMASEGKTLESLDAYRVVSVAVPTTQTGRTAKIALAKAERDPAVRAAVHEVKATALWYSIQQTIAEADEANVAMMSADDAEGPEPTPASLLPSLRKLPVRDQATAMRTLNTILSRYGRTEIATQAKELRNQMKTDQSISKALADWEASKTTRRLMNMATTYEKSKRYAKAAEQYRKVLAAAPDSEAARQAQQRLKALNGKYLTASEF